MVNIIGQEFFTFWLYERGEEVLNLKNWWNLIEDGEVQSGWARCVKVGRKYGIKCVRSKLSFLRNFSNEDKFWSIFIWKNLKMNFFFFNS